MSTLWNKPLGRKSSVTIIAAAAALFAGVVGWQTRARDRARNDVDAGNHPVHLAVLANWQPQDADPGFKPVRLMPPLPAIKEFPIATAAEAQGKLGEAELVLGVEVNGVARAYPINMLTGPQREILNDRLGELPIAATW